MLTILLGFLLSFSSGHAWAENAVEKVPTFESEEEIEARAVAEMTNEGVADAVEQKDPAHELLAGEMEQTALSPKSEAQIPVLTKATSTAQKAAAPLTRLILSLGVILAAAGGMFMFSRFWAKRRTGLKQHHQIKVLTQYGLGPKKSLAIIRVAGESILIGITDHNINMIKSLSLLDEDVPTDVPAEFSHELSRHEVPESVATRILSANIHEKNEKEEFSFGTVRDMVASRIREMRPL